MIIRKKVSWLGAVLLAHAAIIIAIPLQVSAQGYPAKAVRIIVPFPPGGNTDIYARPVSAKMADLYGKQMLIDNRPGAGAHAQGHRRQTQHRHQQNFAGTGHPAADDGQRR